MQGIKEEVTYRAELADCAAPLGLRSVGHAVFQPFQSSSLRKTDFFQALWTVEGEGHVRIGGKDFRLKQDWAAVCPPEKGHVLSSSKKSWEYRWCTFDGPAAGVIVSAFKTPGVPFHAGPCPPGLFESLAESLGNPTPEGERASSAEAYRFLAHLAGKAALSRGSGERRQAGWLLANAALDPSDKDLNVQAIADGSGLSRFSIHRIFRDELGVAPKRYIDSLRLQRAFSLLRETDMTVEQVAAATGFANGNYFAKFFRRKSGLTPSQFREAPHMP